jgi:hypothetical protein
LLPSLPRFSFPTSPPTPAASPRRLRLLEDVGEADQDSAEEGVFDGLIMALKDVKIYLMMLTLTAYVIGLSFNAFFVSEQVIEQL